MEVVVADLSCKSTVGWCSTLMAFRWL